MEKKKLILQMLEDPNAIAYITVNTPDSPRPESIGISVNDAIKLLSPTKKVVKK